MSYALPARQLNFGRSAPQQPAQWQQQQLQHQQAQYGQQQQQQQPVHALALPGGGNPYIAPSNLALPGPSSHPPSQPYAQAKANVAQPTSQPLGAATSQTNGVIAGPSTPAPSAVPSTPAPLTLEQQHITAVEGIVPQLQNIVATVNLDCRLDLKTIALHARNAEYNPKVGSLALFA